MVRRRPTARLRTQRTRRALASGPQIECLESRCVLDSTVVFNEIMYHPESDEALLEWIELYNQQAVDMDLSAWTLQGATSFTFPEGTVIAGRGHLVVAASPESLQSAAAITGVLGPLDGRLSNGGEKLTLRDNNGRLLDEVEYEDDGAWPVAADGSGASLAKRDPASASGPASNWTFSTQVGGTPGAINFPRPDTSPTRSTLVDLNATWAYEQSATDLGTAWRTTGFDDTAWPRHTAPLTSASTSSGSVLAFSGTGATLDGPFAGYTLGWEFNVNSPITVTSVGWFDSGAGLSASHPVGVFNSSGVLLASATVLASDPLVSSIAPQPGAGFRYHSLAAPLTLDVGTYRIGGFNPPGSTDRDYNFVTSLSTVSEVSYVHSYYAPSGSLVYPSTFGDREKGYFGPNLQLAGGTPLLNVGPTTHYFRTEFSYTPAAGTLELSLESLVDDGAIFYLNDVEVYRQNMPAGPVGYSTLASTAVGTASMGAAVTLPTASLMPGNNVLAVEVHQATVPDADVAFNAQLKATVTPLPLAELPQLVFSEVAANVGGPFQIELLNQGSQGIDLAGYIVASPDLIGAQYILPAQTLAPGAYLAITEAQLGFGPGVDRLFLYGPGGTTLLDGVTVQDRLRGRSPDHPGRWLYPDMPTFGAANHFDFHDEVVINEIMYQHAPVVTAPPLIDTTKSVPLADTWKFDQSGADLGTAWRQPDYNDTPWSTGAAPFGGTAEVPYGSVILSHNPTAYWRLGENPTTGTAFDSAPLSGNQNGTYTGVTTRAGVIGADANLAADFNVASTSRVSGTGLDATGVFSGDWTIEAWFVRDAVTSFATLFSNNGASGNTNGPTMAFIDSTNRLGLPAVGTSTANVSLDLGASHLGKPVYAVITKTGGNTAGSNTITIYAWVDGIALTPVSGSTTWNLAPHDAYFIGRYRPIGSQYFDGAIDEVALYNRALTVEEINTHALAGFAGAGVATPLNLGPTTYYFRQDFTFTGDPASTILALRTIVDDGAVFYLNGQEIYRQNMPAGTIGANTAASSEVGAASLSGVIPIVGTLNIGQNVLAVEVHQASPSGQDVRFDAELIATTTVRPAQTFAESDEEWLELYNRSATTVDLSGWKLDEGIDFTFPAATTLAAGEYLVVAKDAAALAAKYPTIRIIGNYNNSLSNSGERVVLKDDRNNPADEVRYYDSGNWPERADGGGSSLELRDPDADNAKAEAWAASDESGKSAWRTYTTRRIAQPYLGSFASPIGGDVPPAEFNEFVLGMLDAGEVLIDDISVIETPDGTPIQLIQNGSFQSDAIGSAPTSWRSGGTQVATVVADPTNPTNRVMRIVSTGATGYIGNDVETTLAGNRAIVTGREYEVSFRAKWIGGSSQLNNRAYFTRIAETTVLDTPRANGTPGAQNSRFSPNIGPTYSEFRHTPVVPAVGQSVTVSVKPADADGVSAVSLRWSANGGAWNNLPMTAGPSGVYAAGIPGQAAGTVVQFYVEATDALGAVSTFPAAGAGSRALFEVDDGAAAPATTLGVDSFRIIMTAADTDKMHAITNLMSTADLGATLIVNEREVFYDVGVQLKGSQHSRSESTRVGFNLTLHPDQLLRGVHRKIAIDRSSRSPGTPKPSPDEIVIKQFLNHAGGLASEYDDIAYVVAPQNAHNSVATLQMARLSSEYLDSQFENGDDSPIYEFEMIFTASGTTGGVEGQKLHGAGPFLDYDVEDLGPDKEVYRFHMQKENNLAEDDFSRIIALGQALELTGPALDAAAAQVLDADQWMRTFAARSLIMDFDGYGTPTYRHNHNLKFYVRPEDQKVLAFLWDIDGAFTLSPTGPLWPQGGPDTLSKLIERPDNLHRYYGHLHDMISTSWNTTYLGPWMASYSEQAGQNLSANLPLVQQRADFVLSQLPPQTPFLVSDAPPVISTSTLIDENAAATAFVPSVENGGSVLGTSWTDSSFSDATWQSGFTGVGYENAPGDLVNFSSLLHLNPAGMAGVNESVFVRVPFNYSGNVADIDRLRLQMKYDDGFVAYLNGVKVAEANAPATLTWNSGATTIHDDTAAVVFQDFDISAFKNLLAQGTNVLAIHGLNRLTTSSDMLILPKLVADDVISGDDSIVVPGPNATIGGSGWINVREIRIQGRPDAILATWLSPTTWQATIAAQPGTHALTFEAYDFQGNLIGTDSITVTSTQPNLLIEHLRVDEIMYHPADPTPAEMAAGFDDADDFEFLELVNTSAVETLDLSGVKFTNGITFDFAGSALTSLPPGGRVVIVENLAAFTARYGAMAGLVAGQYAGRLDNAGELLRFEDGGGVTIQTFIYDDNGPGWHPSTDGLGNSLVIVDATGDTANWNLGAQWRPSFAIGGSPGERDTLPGDFNGDLRVSLIDLAILQANLGLASGATAASGDMNGDGMVNRSDVAQFSRSFGKSHAATASSAAASAPAASLTRSASKKTTHAVATSRRSRPIAVDAVFDVESFASLKATPSNLALARRVLSRLTHRPKL